MQRDCDKRSLQKLIGFLQQGGTLYQIADVAKQDLETIYHYSLQLYQSHEYACAQKFALLLVSFDTSSLNYWQLLGRCYHAAGGFDEAIYAFSRALDICPYDAKTICMVADSLIACKKFVTAEKALRSAQNCCEKYPDHQQNQPLAGFIQQQLSTLRNTIIAESNC